MARATTRLLERLAVQVPQPRVSAPAPMPRASVSQQSRPSAAAARPASAEGQGRDARPAVPPTPPITRKLTLGAAVPPQVAARIAQVRAAATPVPAPEQAKPLAPRRVDQGTSQQNQKFRPGRQQPQSARSESSTKQKHDGPHPIERLIALYPAVFSQQAPKPLAIGVEQQIAQVIGIHPKAAAQALSRWCRRVNYSAAVAAPGAHRVNLDGSDAGEVAPEHRAHAAEVLALMMAVTLAPATEPLAGHADGH